MKGTVTVKFLLYPSTPRNDSKFLAKPVFWEVFWGHLLWFVTHMDGELYWYSTNWLGDKLIWELDFVHSLISSISFVFDFVWEFEKWGKFTFTSLPSFHSSSYRSSRARFESFTVGIHLNLKGFRLYNSKYILYIQSFKLKSFALEIIQWIFNHVNAGWFRTFVGEL